jgi:hypothetical protein
LFHSLVVRHLVCFHSLSLVNSAANIGAFVFYKNTLGVVLLDHMTHLCLAFEGAAIVFYKVVVLAYNPVSSV